MTDPLVIFAAVMYLATIVCFGVGVTVYVFGLTSPSVLPGRLGVVLIGLAFLCIALGQSIAPVGMAVVDRALCEAFLARCI